jgi:enoyl-CoA hydratase/carnithine racemase
VTQASLVKTQRSGPVATLTLNRPERHNSLVPELLTELLAAFREISDEASVRAVVLGAAGRSFSTGGDVKAFFSAGEDLAEYAAETVGILNQVIVTMLRLPQPIVTAVHGMVTGGSLGLVLASDVVLIAPSATITPWYSVVGFSPDGGWTAMLPDIIGTDRTAALLLANQSITAQQAVDWGIAAEVVAAEMIDERAEAVANEIARMKPGAIASTKTLLRPDLDAVAGRLEAERRAFIDQIVTAEALKGMAAFLGRRR